MKGSFWEAFWYIAAVFCLLQCECITWKEHKWNDDQLVQITLAFAEHPVKLTNLDEFRKVPDEDHQHKQTVDACGLCSWEEIRIIGIFSDRQWSNKAYKNRNNELIEHLFFPYFWSDWNVISEKQLLQRTAIVKKRELRIITQVQVLLPEHQTE